MSSRTAVVIGMGELGALFAQGFLKSGLSVVPILRGAAPDEALRSCPDPQLCLIAVGEDDLEPVLASLPSPWRNRVGLLQNELLPDVWQRLGVSQPTVVVVWFEKKPGRVARELLPSRIYGPRAGLFAQAIERLGLSATVLTSESELVRALVDKNIYILTSNIAGLETGGTVRELLADHRELCEAVLDDVLALQARRVGLALPRAEIIEAFVRAVNADPEHACTGRSAPARLDRAISAGDALGLELPTLRRIAAGSARGTPEA